MLASSIENAWLDIVKRMEVSDERSEKLSGVLIAISNLMEFYVLLVTWI